MSFENETCAGGFIQQCVSLLGFLVPSKRVHVCHGSCRISFPCAPSDIYTLPLLDRHCPTYCYAGQYPCACPAIEQSRWRTSNTRADARLLVFLLQPDLRKDVGIFQSRRSRSTCPNRGQTACVECLSEDMRVHRIRACLCATLRKPKKIPSLAGPAEVPHTKVAAFTQTRRIPTHARPDTMPFQLVDTPARTV